MIKPVYVTTNAKGVAVFQVSDTLIQKVTYSATDLTDGVLLDAARRQSATSGHEGRHPRRRDRAAGFIRSPASRTSTCCPSATDR